MATDTQRQRLRMDLGFAADDTTSLPDATIDDIYVRVEEKYTDADSIEAATRLLAFDQLLIQAAADVDYTQNENSKKASQRHTHLSKERDKWQKRLDDAIGAARGSGVKSGRTTRKPARIKEYPGSWGW